MQGVEESAPPSFVSMRDAYQWGLTRLAEPNRFKRKVLIGKVHRTHTASVQRPMGDIGTYTGILALWWKNKWERNGTETIVYLGSCRDI